MPRKGEELLSRKTEQGGRWLHFIERLSHHFCVICYFFTFLLQFRWNVSVTSCVMNSNRFGKFYPLGQEWKWKVWKYIYLLKICVKGNLHPSPSSNFIIKRKNLRVDVKATGCHFPINSTKHMGVELHLSQIVKIFFKKPKSSKDGSKCAWFPWVVSSTTFTLTAIFINTHMAHQGLIGYWWTRDRIMIYHLHGM